MANHWNYSGDYYVSALDGNDTSGDGSADNPVKTISKAILLAEVSSGTYDIVVGTGIYNETLNSATTTRIMHLQGDGVVILDGNSLSYATSGYPNQWRATNFKVVNFTYIMYAATNYGLTWVDCSFKNSIFNGLNITTNSPNENVFLNCRFENVTGHPTLYQRYLKFKNCTLINSSVGGTLGGSYSNNSYLPNMDNCLFSADSGSRVILTSTATSGQPLTNCVFGPNLYAVRSGVLYTIPDYLSEFKPSHNLNSIEASMSFNTNITGAGDWNLLSTTMPINETTSALYKNISAAPLNSAGGYAPRTAYGFDNSSSNPLHTEGGATWANIVTSSLGGFQISSSSVPSGSITTAVIDQGGVKAVKNIDSGWTTNFNNTAAPTTYPSGSNNHHPVRYQYEMRYGNNPSLSGTYSIFEWGQVPYVNSNGTGSGDQLFNTGSYSSISARYLQLKITLRSDLSGSI